LHFVEQWTPIANAIALRTFEAHMSSRSQQTILQILAKSIVDCEGDNQRRNSSRDSDDGDGRDHSNHGLAALGSQVSRGNEELEWHCLGEYNSSDAT
jgi:hypothetical protein